MYPPLSDFADEFPFGVRNICWKAWESYKFSVLSFLGNRHRERNRNHEKTHSSYKYASISNVRFRLSRPWKKKIHLMIGWYSSEIPATELMLKGHRPAQVGSVGIFFNCCADVLSALTRETCFLNQLQEKQRFAFWEIFGKFHFGGTGSLAEKGELDKVLNVSASLKDQITLLLVQIAKILCSKETCDLVLQFG